MKHTSASRIVALVGLCALAVTGCSAATGGSAGSPASAVSTASTASTGAASVVGASASSAAGASVDSGAGSSLDSGAGSSVDSGAGSPAVPTVPAVTQSSAVASVPTSTDAATPPSSASPAGTPPPHAAAALPAARCLSSDLRPTLATPGGAAGSVYYSLVFTNAGATPCTLQGFPGVSYVTGTSGRQVGGAARWEGPSGRAVVLKPGARATAQLQEVDVANFPRAVCDPVAVRGLRVYPPGETHALFVPQTGGHGCTKHPLPDGQFQLSVTAITAG